MALRPEALVGAHALRAQKSERRKLVESAIAQATKDAARFAREIRKLRRKLSAAAREAAKDQGEERKAIVQIERAEEAASLRRQGLRWGEVAHRIGYRSPGGAFQLVDFVFGNAKAIGNDKRKPNQN